MIEEDLKKDFKDLKNKLELIYSEHPTHVVLLVVHKDLTLNDITRLNCKHFIPIEGYSTNTKVVAVGGYVYDRSSDCYLINCIDHYYVGAVPFSYKLKVDGVGNWAVNVPLPEPIIKRSLDENHRENLHKFKTSYSKSEFDFQFIQFIC